MATLDFGGNPTWELDKNLKESTPKSKSKSNILSVYALGYDLEIKLPEVLTAYKDKLDKSKSIPAPLQNPDRLTPLQKLYATIDGMETGHEYQMRKRRFPVDNFRWDNEATWAITSKGKKTVVWTAYQTSYYPDGTFRRSATSYRYNIKELKKLLREHAKSNKDFKLLTTNGNKYIDIRYYFQLHNQMLDGDTNMYRIVFAPISEAQI